MKQATERLWRTADGRLVRDGDEAGEFLAYAPGHVIEAKDEHLVPGDEPEPEPEPEAVQDKPRLMGKAAVKPADKQAPKPDDK